MSWCSSASIQFEPSTFHFNDAKQKIFDKQQSLRIREPSSSCCACPPNQIRETILLPPVYSPDRFPCQQSRRPSSCLPSAIEEQQQRGGDLSLSIPRSHQPLYDSYPQQTTAGTSEQSFHQANISHHINVIDNTGSSTTQSPSLTRRLINAFSSVYKPFAYNHSQQQLCQETQNRPLATLLLNNADFHALIHQYSMKIDRLEREIHYLTSQSDRNSRS